MVHVYKIEIWQKAVAFLLCFIVIYLVDRLLTKMNISLKATKIISFIAGMIMGYLFYFILSVNNIYTYGP